MAGTATRLGRSAAESVYGGFDFGLSAEQETRAASLHREALIVDMTFQGPCSPDVWTDALHRELDAAMSAPDDFETASSFLLDKAIDGDFPEYRALFVASGVAAGLTGCVLRDDEAILKAAAELARLTQALPWLRPLEKTADISDAHAVGDHVVWGMCQLNLLRPGELALIDAAHELGVLHTAECAYNVMTFIGAGCTERYDPGLSYFGLEFVKRCNDIGVVVDTAHSGRQTTLDACAASGYPVIATHTSAAALYPHDRAKSDDEIRAIAETGGVVGVVAVPGFLSPPEAGPLTIELMLDHIDYIATLVGWRHVGIGTDWPLPLPHDILRDAVMPLLLSMGFRPEHNLDLTATLEGFRDYRDLINITRGLVSRGYSDEQIHGILGENFLRILERVNG